MNERIRELRRAGWSERRIASELGITRHCVRTALHRFQQPTPIQRETWTDEVELHIARARLRKDDFEQIELGHLAFDAADWLDARDDDGWNARQLGISLRYAVQGVVDGSNPLVRIHAGRARRLMAETTRLRPEV